MRYLPNTLTILRIFFIPLFIFFIFSNFKYSKEFALLIFSFAVLTDYYDGFFARKYNVVSNFGKFFDPLADKLLILSAFLSFLFLPVLSSVISVWMFLVILLRDIFITSFRLFLSSSGKKFRTSKFAKFKTAFQMLTVYSILIYLLILRYDFLSISSNYNATWFLYILMISTTLMTIISGLRYLIKNLDKIYIYLCKKKSTLDL